RLGAGGGDLQGLLEQDVLAGGRRPRDQLAVGVGRRQDHHRLHARIGEERVEVGGQREREAGAEGRAAGFGRAPGAGDLDLVGEVEEALRVRRHRHAEADEADAEAAGQPSSPSPFSPFSATSATETTCSSGAVAKTRTPPAERDRNEMSETGTRIDWPASVASITWSWMSTGKSVTSGPPRIARSIAATPWPPRPRTG